MHSLQTRHDDVAFLYILVESTVLSLAETSTFIVVKTLRELEPLATLKTSPSLANFKIALKTRLFKAAFL